MLRSELYELTNNLVIRHIDVDGANMTDMGAFEIELFEGCLSLNKGKGDGLDEPASNDFIDANISVEKYFHEMFEKEPYNEKRARARYRHVYKCMLHAYIAGMKKAGDAAKRAVANASGNSHE